MAEYQRLDPDTRIFALRCGVIAACACRNFFGLIARLSFPKVGDHE
ncbi:MAG: hypothetical protein O9289_05645 [Rhodobacteraceae bacterium]|jgi:hypothetical protein|nr:hypothetical protein [Paracoccaceae bacterium]